MKNQIILTIALLALIAISACSGEKANTTKVIIHDQFRKATVYAEIADTEEARAKGLMFREELCKDCGMLFVFPDNKERSFWMKNTYLPLDIIYINENNTIVSIRKKALPCNTEKCASYPSIKLAKYVLEVNAGFADYYEINAGDRIDIK